MSAIEIDALVNSVSHVLGEATEIVGALCELDIPSLSPHRGARLKCPSIVVGLRQAPGRNQVPRRSFSLG